MYFTLGQQRLEIHHWAILWNLFRAFLLKMLWMGYELILWWKTVFSTNMSQIWKRVPEGRVFWCSQVRRFKSRFSIILWVLFLWNVVLNLILELRVDISYSWPTWIIVSWSYLLSIEELRRRVTIYGWFSLLLPVRLQRVQVCIRVLVFHKWSLWLVLVLYIHMRLVVVLLVLIICTQLRHRCISVLLLNLKCWTMLGRHCIFRIASIFNIYVAKHGVHWRSL